MVILVEDGDDVDEHGLIMLLDGVQFCYASEPVPLIGFLCCEKYAAVAGSPAFVVCS